MTIENNPAVVGSVAAWQNILNGCGYPLLHITGNLDGATAETTKKFQSLTTESMQNTRKKCKIQPQRMNSGLGN